MERNYGVFSTLEEKLEQKLAFKKMTTEELEASIQKEREFDAKLTDWLPVPDTYIDL